MAYAFVEALFHLVFTYDCLGEENVPEKGPAVVAANHPSCLPGAWGAGLPVHAAAGLAGWLAGGLFPYHRRPGAPLRPVIVGRSAGGSPPADRQGPTT